MKNRSTPVLLVLIALSIGACSGPGRRVFPADGDAGGGVDAAPVFDGGTQDTEPLPSGTCLVTIEQRLVALGFTGRLEATVDRSGRWLSSRYLNDGVWGPRSTYLYQDVTEEYDGFDRVIRREKSPDGSAFIRFYDGAGRLAMARTESPSPDGSLPNWSQTDITYDGSSERLSAAQRTFSDGSAPEEFSYTYAADGTLTEWVRRFGPEDTVVNTVRIWEEYNRLWEKDIRTPTDSFPETLDDVIEYTADPSCGDDEAFVPIDLI